MTSGHFSKDCKNDPKCVNCGKDHLSRSNECEVWKKEKEIMKIKITKKLTYPEAKKLYETKPDTTYAKVLSAKVATKTVSTQYNEKDSELTESSKIITANISKSPPKTNSQNNSKSSQSTRSKSVSRTQSNSRSQQPRTDKSPNVKEGKKQTSNRTSKGSEDPVKLANKYSNLEEMETEVGSQPHHSSRRN